MSRKVNVTIPHEGSSWAGLLTGLMESIPELSGSIAIDAPNVIRPEVLQAYINVFSEGGLTRSDVDVCLRMPQFSLQKMWAAASDFMDGPLYRCPIDPWLLSLYLLNERLGHMAVADNVARHTLFRKMSLPAGAYQSLISLHPKHFDVEEHRILSFDFEHGGFLELPDVKRSEPNFGALRRMCLKELPDTLPWLSKARYEERFEGVIAAGGRMVSALYERKVRHQDVDLFVVAQSSSAAKTIIIKTVLKLAAAYHPKHFVVTCYMKSHVTDVLVMRRKRCSGDRFVVKYQIIHKAYPTPSHVVHGFDIDICGVLFDGRGVYATANAARAIANGFNLYDQNKMSSSAEHRYAKYMLNYGFKTLIVGITASAISSKFEEVCAEAQTLLSQYKLYGETPATRAFCKIVHSPLGLLQRVAAMSYLPQQCAGKSVECDYSSNELLEFLTQMSLTCIIKAPFRISSRLCHIPCACSEESPMFTGAFNPVDVDLVAPALLREFV